MSIFSSKEEQDREIYEDAQKRGSESNWLDQMAHAALSTVYPDKENEGWDNGVRNQPKG